MAAQMPAIRRSLEEYAVYAGEETIREITKLAEPLKGSRMLHLSSVPSRPQVANALNTLIPLLQSIGIVADWRAVPTEWRNVELKKSFNLALDGQFVDCTAGMLSSRSRREAEIANIDLRKYDFVAVHDAEVVGLSDIAADRRKTGRAKWIWHCHSDLTHTQPDVQDFLMARVRHYDRRMMCGGALSHAHGDAGFVTVSPVFDPLGPRNCDLPHSFIEMVLSQHGLDSQRPFLLYTLRGRDDLFVVSNIVEGFKLAKQLVPELKLLVLIEGEGDDERTQTHYGHLLSKLGGCKDVRFVAVANGLGSMEINALQRAAAAVLEWTDHVSPVGDLLDVMWKARPVIMEPATARMLGGEDGRNVYVARSASDCANRIVGIIKAPEVAKAIGQGAREYVQKEFLITWLLHAYVSSCHELANPKVATAA